MSADKDGVWAPGRDHDVQLTNVEPTDFELSQLSPDVIRESNLVSRSNSMPQIVFGIIATLVIVAIVVTGFGDPDDVEPPAAALPDPEVTEEDPSGLRTEQSATFLEALPEAGDYLMFFRSDDSLAVLDFRDGSSELMDWGVPDGIETKGFMYLASERGSWVVDPNNLSRALRLAPRAQIAVLRNPTRTAVLAEVSGVTTVFGGFFDGRSVRVLASVPVGSNAEAIQKLGVIISPLTGGSYLIQETWPTLVSSGRIVAANAHWFAEVLCDDRLRCTANIRSWDDDMVTPIPIDVLATAVVRISPDGRWVLSGGTSHWSIYDVAKQTSVATGDDVVPNGSATWSPDSAFFLWIDARTLSAARPERPSERVNLTLGVEPLIGLITTEIGFLPVADTE
ncbi:MAG: hypothetical protein P8Q52_15865 [Acidimicrobiales bacterium]|nr:hypothetical protein [Acidimicrobiales bacterium]